MSPREAKRILELLAQGIDPETGEVLPPDTLLESPAVIRAMFFGARALALVREEDWVRANNESHAGTSWTRAEDERLIAAFDTNTSIERLAELHGRSKGAIAARLVRLGRIKERSDVYTREPRSRKTDSQP